MYIFYSSVYNNVPVLFVFELFCKCQGSETNLMYLVFYEVKTKCILLFNGLSVKELGLLHKVQLPQNWVFFLTNGNLI